MRIRCTSFFHVFLTLSWPIHSGFGNQGRSQTTQHMYPLAQHKVSGHQEEAVTMLAWQQPPHEIPCKLSLNNSAYNYELLDIILKLLRLLSPTLRLSQPAPPHYC